MGTLQGISSDFWNMSEALLITIWLRDMLAPANVKTNSYLI